MKIAYCIPQLYNPGGIERIVLLKARLLSNLGYDIHIITAEQLGKPSFFSVPSTVTLHDLGVDFSSTLTMPLMQRLIIRKKKMIIYKNKLTQLLIALKCDIVISTFSHEVNILPAIKDGSIKIAEAHFPKSHLKLMAKTFGYSLTTKIIYYIKNWIVENYIIPKYKTLIVLTQTDKEEWRKKHINAICIPNLITFSNNSTHSDLSEKRVLAIGHFSKIKSFDSLIRIWSIIKKHDREWILTIVGNGKEYPHIQKLINDLNLNDSIEIIPPTNSIQLIYLKSSIYALTSKYEGFSMVLIEAMQCGLPCVAFDCPNGPRDIIDHGKNGYLIHPDNYDQFASYLLKLMQDTELRTKMGETASKSIKRYSQENIIQQWDKLFNEIKNQRK